MELRRGAHLPFPGHWVTECVTHGQTLIMRHRLSGISTYGLNGLGNVLSLNLSLNLKGLEPKLYSEYYGIFTFLVYLCERLNRVKSFPNEMAL